jgi:hypothetical protein
MGIDHKIGFGLRDLIGDRLADLLDEGRPSVNRLFAQALRDGWGALSPDQRAVLEAALVPASAQAGQVRVTVTIPASRSDELLAFVATLQDES